MDNKDNFSREPSLEKCPSRTSSDMRKLTAAGRASSSDQQNLAAAQCITAPPQSADLTGDGESQPSSSKAHGGVHDTPTVFSRLEMTMGMFGNSDKSLPLLGDLSKSLPFIGEEPTILESKGARFAPPPLLDPLPPPCHAIRKSKMSVPKMSVARWPPPYHAIRKPCPPAEAPRRQGRWAEAVWRLRHSVLGFQKTLGVS